MSIKLYQIFIDAGMTSQGACGLLGNLSAESALRSNNLQNSYQSKLGMTDEQYTKAVDNGSYTNFVYDSAGYGLAQWTYWSRKQSLLKYAKSMGKSIGDEEMQAKFLIKEIKEYSNVFKILTTTKSVREASDAVLLKYERPADSGESVQKYRAKLGQEFYNKYVGKEKTVMAYSRQKVVDLANSWVGRKESDGSHKYIIDIYNSQKKFPRGTPMQYDWAWCAATWSAIAVKLGYQKIMPIEISCYYIIEIAKKMGCWVETDSYVPKPGDAILYDWDDSGRGDNRNSADHIGTVVYVNKSSGYMVVTEGNYSNAVKKRTISINGRYIRGFITPKYTENTVSKPAQESNKSVTTIAREVIAGQWGTGTERRKALEAKGYNYNEVQEKVNDILNGNAKKPVTSTSTKKSITATCAARNFSKYIADDYKATADLYMRNDAGTNKKALVLMPKGTKVKCYGYYNISNGTKWYYIQCTINGVKYTGFSHSGYLKRI